MATYTQQFTTTGSKWKNYESRRKALWSELRTMKPGGTRNRKIKELDWLKSQLKSLTTELNRLRPLRGTDEFKAPPGTLPTPGKDYDPSTPGIQGPSVDQKDAFSRIKDALDYYGLGNLTQWLWDQIVKGEPDSAVFLNLRQTPEFKARFPGIDDRRQKGLPAISPETYVENEAEYKSLLRNFGMDPSLYDSPNDFRALFASDIRPEEFGARLDKYFTVTKTFGPRVAQDFQNFAGVSLNDKDLYYLFSGQRPDLEGTFEQVYKTPFPKMFGLRQVQDNFDKALSLEKSRFSAGGGTKTSLTQTSGAF